MDLTALMSGRSASDRQEGIPYRPGPEPEEAPTFSEKLLAFWDDHRSAVIIGAAAVAAVVVIAILLSVFLGGRSASDPYDNRILNNVTIAGVNVGGMTKSEAVRAVRSVTNDTYTKEDMVIQLPDETITLSPDKTGAKLDVSAAVEAAFSYGRTGSLEDQKRDYEASLTGNHTIGLLPYLGLNEEAIHGVLDAFSDKYSGRFTQSGYTLDGEQPPLDAENFSESNPCQTLVLTMGTPGLGIDMDDLFNRILDAYSLNQFLVTVSNVTTESTPDPLDLDAIYQEFYIAPVGAVSDPQTYEVIPGTYGYGFDLEKAKALLEGAQYGDTVTVPFEYIAPENSGDGLYFQDVLGSCETPHTNSENRNTNLRLACEALNGLVIKPGEVFSYNQSVGQRTTEKGYKPAPAWSGNKLVDTVGGGVCQVSSTLYYCTLLADLEVVDRINHGFASSYIDLGMDATVSWNTVDYKFKNTSNYPIKILAEVSDGYVKMKIMGTDEKDYYIKMEYEITGKQSPKTVYEEHKPGDGYKDGEVLEKGTTGIYVKSYKCKYSKETDKLISRDFEARSSYRTVDKVVVKIIEDETTPPETTPPETTPPETTPPETTPQETTPPETTPPGTTPPETTPPATTPPETTPPETTPPETKAPETTPPETKPPETPPAAPAPEADSEPEA